MSVSVEIEVEGDKCDKCGADMKGAATAEPSKDALLAELKGLLSQTSSAGQADRQMKIDELISKISELGD